MDKLTAKIGSLNILLKQFKNYHLKTFDIKKEENFEDFIKEVLYSLLKQYIRDCYDTNGHIKQPDLEKMYKRKEYFMDLQNNLKDTEDKIAAARQFYNDTVLTYQNKIEMFPSSIVAKMFGFKPEEFFKVSEADKELPKVKF